MFQDYPVTRLQAAKCLRRGDTLELDLDQGESNVQVMVRWQTLPRGAVCRLWAGPGVLWLKLDWKQILGFIRRNYDRTYL